MEYKPEGTIYGTTSNQKYISTAAGLSEAMNRNITLEGKVILCTSSHDLIVDLPCGRGIIPREEGAVGVKEGTTRDIALISRVNKIVCFKIASLTLSDSGEITAQLSRKAAQEECQAEFVSKLVKGDIIDATVTHLEQFGSFVDIGCGIPSLIPIDAMSVSRISHPSDRFYPGQKIKAVVTDNIKGRINLTHKELLGTWDENASKFNIGETVPGIVRSIESYGVFVELSPNLAGLTEPYDDIKIGQSVSVYIKAIIPEKMKIKLIIVDICCERAPVPEYDYFIADDHIENWVYSSRFSDKIIKTSFS
ncbi:MAG: S1 RNA-binding domain-containing protein [Ruminococcus sp.]|uniref:S1 RNA-binding domain-containing protein n=1 Tax=Ruminococcus sp. TaxID=41978 RepID=UPI0025FBA21C|nr:S1 RNA-binding domain-containing protein [Ruminococcus sp.]MBR5683726.1 S1 RNA-binding domain-containing protein [Ruminococcus sp.]